MTDKKTPTLAQAGGFKLNNKIIAKKIQNINKKGRFNYNIKPNIWDCKNDLRIS